MCWLLLLEPPTLAPTLAPTTPTLGPTELPTLLPTLPSAPPTSGPSFPPTSHPSQAPTVPPSLNPSYQPSIAPSMLPTNLNNYKLIIYSQFNIQCTNISSFNEWFIKNTYYKFRQLTMHIFVNISAGYMKYYQFDLQFQTINNQYNVSKLPDYFDGNVSLLEKELHSQTLAHIYVSQITNYQSNMNKYSMDITIQYKIYAMVSVETVFQGFYGGFMHKSVIEVWFLCFFCFFFLFIVVGIHHVYVYVCVKCMANRRIWNLTILDAQLN